ncbi:polynucleotide adenylyltransferase PcnB, partial [Enterococcus hirae]
AAKLEFAIEANTAKPIKKLSHLLHQVPNARLYDEMLKLFFEGNAAVTYAKLQQFDYGRILFPQTFAVLDRHNKDIY